MTRLMLSQVEIREDILNEDKYRYVFSVEAVNQLVKNGMSFREAYRKIGNDIQQGKFKPPALDMNEKNGHTGSITNLSNDLILTELKKVLNKFS